MGLSNSHKLGQLIGDILEAALTPIFQSFADEHGLYLDKKGERIARKGKKVSWVDHYGNSHDLDFVLEKDGIADTIGKPIAFIESAWRSYTKHSRNKAQEIQSAILPLNDTFKNFAPFKGVVLAGEFTEGAIKQLKSLGFLVAYFPGSIIFKAFEQGGIDVHFSEDTSEKELEAKVKSIVDLKDTSQIEKAIIELNRDEINHLLQELENSVKRAIDRIIICPLYGKRFEFSNIKEALTFIETIKDISGTELQLNQIFIQITYSNKSYVEATFTDISQAIEHLNRYLKDL